jgi:hypothetical protein
MLSGGCLLCGDGGFPFAFGTPITLAADAAFIVSQSIDAAQTALDEPIARNIETTIASPVERKTVRAMTQAPGGRG